jgi:uncharacterized protein YnzC (UPF0291/DUF896 family)
MAQEITNQFLSGLLAGPSALQAAEQQQAIELAKLTPMQQSAFAGISAGQAAGRGLRGMFNVKTPDETRMDVRAQARKTAASEAGGDRLKFLESYANALDASGDAEGAFQARSILDQERRTSAESASKVFQQTAAGTASVAQAGRERRASLAERLVELDTLKATRGLSPAEENERVALERVVKLQAPKEPPGAAALETAESQEVGKGAGAQFTKVTITDVNASEQRMRAVRELQVLAGQVDTGAFAEIKAKAQSLFKDLGVNIGDPTNAQTLRAAIERGVAQSQLEQKGVQTDRDATRYRTAGVLLTNTPAANQYIVDYQTALDQRTREKARFFEDFRARTKSSVGAEAAWNDFIKDKDIFDSPSLSKYKDLFKMNDLAKRAKEGTASEAEKRELAALMRQYGLKEIRVSQ